MDDVAVIFVASVVYAVFGNAAVYVILARRKVPMSFMWSGTPGYLYRICTGAPTVGRGLRRFALSTNIALVIALIAGIGLAGFHEHRLQ